MLWLQKREPDRPWADLPIHVPEQVRVFFAAAIYSEVGDRATYLFWTDRWLHEQCIADVAPLAVIAVRSRCHCCKETQEENSGRSPHHMHGSQTYKGLALLGSSLTISYGTSYLTLCCSLKWKIDTYGDLLQMGNIPLNLLMRAYFGDLFLSGHGKNLEDLGTAWMSFLFVVGCS